MTIDEFEEYAKSHNILIMTREFYENRLKADMVAMLADLLIDVEEIESREQWCDYANDNCISRYDVEDLIQQKITALKAESEDV